MVTQRLKELLRVLLTHSYSMDIKEKDSLYLIDSIYECSIQKRLHDYVTNASVKNVEGIEL